MHRLASLLPPGAKEAKPRKVETIFSFRYSGDAADGPIKRFNIIYRNEECLAKKIGEVDYLLRVLKDDIEFCLAEIAETQFFLHAGVVGWKDRAILIPGRSYSGKSTLVYEFLRAGAVYYSDEYALIDSRGRVRPYPRPLSIRGSGDESCRVSAEELSAVVGRKPLPIGVILLSTYQGEAVWRPREVPPGKAALRLLANSVSVRRRPERLLKVAKQIVTSCPVVTSPRGEAKEVVEWCAKYL